MNDQIINSDEIWRPIKGYDGLYEVSNQGRVRSKKRKGTDGRILRQKEDRKGYMYVSLCKNGKYKLCLIHRLVAMAYIENVNKDPCVNHKDENKKNNHAENLEWCSYQYNNNYGTARERATRKRYKPCIGIWPDGTVRRYDSCTIASKDTGIGQGNIWGACNGLQKRSGGVIWRYE